MFEANQWFRDAQKLLNKLDIHFTEQQNLELYKQFISTWGEVQKSALQSMNNIQFQPQPKNGIGYTTELLEVNDEEETE